MRRIPKSLFIVTLFVAITGALLGQVVHEFGQPGTASGGFKPEGGKFLISDKFYYWDTYLYVNDNGSSINNIIIKADGTNLISFDVDDLGFSVYENKTVSITITATLSGGGTQNVSISNKSMVAGKTYSLKNDFGLDFNTFDDVTQLSFDFSLSEVWNLIFKSMSVHDQKEPTASGTKPGTQITDLGSSVVGGEQIGLKWTNGNGSRRIVFAKQGSSGAPVISDNTTYEANPDFSSATDIGSGWKCVYKGSNNHATVKGLSERTTYRFIAYEMDGSGGGEAFLTAENSNSVKQATITEIADWSSQNYLKTLDGTNNFWSWTVGALGPDGNTYVAHYYNSSSTSKKLEIEKWDGSSWSTITSFLPSDVGVSGFSDDIAITVDSNNHIHLAFRGSIGSGVTSNRGVLYGYYNGATWSFDQVFLASHSKGWYNCDEVRISVDPSNNPYILYQFTDADTRRQEIRIASKSGTWSTLETLSTVTNYNDVNTGIDERNMHIRVDQSGKIHVIYKKLGADYEHDLIYRTNASGSWTSSTIVDGTNENGIYSLFLTLDKNDKIHAIYNSSDYTQRYLTNKGGSWETTTILNSGYFYGFGIYANNNNTIAITGIGNGFSYFIKEEGEPWYISGESDAVSDVEGYYAATFNDSNKVVVAYTNYLDVRPRKMHYFTSNYTAPAPAPVLPDSSRLYWTDSGSGFDHIRTANLDGTNAKNLITGLDYPRGIAIDGTNGKIYWVDSGTDSINRADLDGGNIEGLVGFSGASSTFKAIALDVPGGKMYWIDSSRDSIYCADLDGSNVESLIGNIDVGQSLALDLTNNKIYWTDSGKDIIWRADLNGSNIESIINATYTNLQGIAIDEVNSKIYFVDSGTDAIYKAELNGSNIKVLITGLNSPQHIAIDTSGEKMYWTDSGTGYDHVQRANTDGTEREIIASGLKTPIGIALYIRPNDLPTSISKTLSTDEDSLLTVKTTDFSYADADGDPFSKIMVIETVAAGKLFLDINTNNKVDNGEEITDAQVIMKDSLDKGQLKFIPAADSNGNAYAFFSFKVHDGIAYSSEKDTIVIDVKAVNDPPVITSTDSTGIAENTTTALTVTSSDFDGASPQYAITGGDDQAKFQIGATSGILSFKAAPDYDNPADNNGDNIYLVEVTVSDGNSGYDVQAIKISVVNVNEAPVITSKDSVSVQEGDTTVITVTATDEDGDTLLFSITGGDDKDLFKINHTNNRILFKSAPDYEKPADTDKNNVYILEITVEDGKDSSDVQTIKVMVKNKNEVPVITSSDSIVVVEGNTFAVTLTATDEDGDSPAFSITGGVDKNFFTITGGKLNFKSAPDFGTPADSDGNNVYKVEVTADDGNGGTLTQAIKVTVVSANTEPEITSTDSDTITENNTEVKTVTATDADSDSLKFSISGGADQALFSIHTTSGALSFVGAPDYESPGDSDSDSVYVVEVTVSDGKGGTDVQTISITVQDENEAPGISKQSFSVNENSEEETSVGTVVASDEDFNQIIAYKIISGNDDEYFEIDGSSGEITVLDANGLDYETDTSYMLVVQVSDNASVPLNASAEITVLVKDLNEAPMISDQSFTVDENSEEETLVGTVLANDQDKGQVLTYSITEGNDDEYFEIDESTGEIIVLDANGLDYESNESFELTVEATDNGTPVLSQTAKITIKLNDLNELPAFSSQEFYVDENSEEETVVAKLIASDVDAGQTLSFTIEEGNDDEYFELDESTGEIIVLDPNGLDYETTPKFEFMVKVSDNGVPPLFRTATVTINLNDVNEAPAVQPLSASVNENAVPGTNVGSIVAKDPDKDAKLTYSIVKTKSSGIPFSIDSIAGTLKVSVASLDYETGPIIEFYVQVSDGELSSRGKVTVNLNNLNDNFPALTDSAFTIDREIKNGDIVGTLNVTDADGDISSITIKVISGNELGVFEIDSLTGEITAIKTELIDFVSADTVTIAVKISDGENEVTANVSIAPKLSSGAGSIYGVTETITAYPVPAKHIISVKSDKEDIIRINIIAINGQIIRSVTPDGNSKFVEIDIDELDKGSYFIEVLTRTGSEKVIKAIKQ